MSCRNCHKDEPEVFITSCNYCGCAICTSCAYVVYSDRVTIFKKYSLVTRNLCPSCYKRYKRK